jgi:hypothetical protein
MNTLEHNKISWFNGFLNLLAILPNTNVEKL